MHTAAVDTRSGQVVIKLPGKQYIIITYSFFSGHTRRRLFDVLFSFNYLSQSVLRHLNFIITLSIFPSLSLSVSSYYISKIFTRIG